MQPANNHAQHISLQDMRTAANASATFVHVLLLDQLWTAHVSGTDAVAAEDVATLRAITAELHVLLGQAAGLAGSVSDLATRYGQEIDAQVEAVGRRPTLRRERWQQVHGSFQAHGGPSAYLRVASGQFAHLAPDESAEIERKMQRIARGGPASADLSKSAFCFLAGAVTVLGAFALQPEVAGIGSAVFADQCL